MNKQIKHMITETKKHKISLDTKKIGAIIKEKFLLGSNFMISHIKKTHVAHWIIAILLGLCVFFAYKASISKPVIITKKEEKVENKFNIIRKLERAKISHAYYTKAMSKEELMVKWIEMFSEINYRMNGDLKFKQSDCSSSVFLFLKSMGYQGEMMGVRAVDTKIVNLSNANLIKIRKSYTKVKPGDLILFKPGKSGIAHIGIVTHTKNWYVCYADVNGSIGMGFGKMRWGDNRINKISEVSFAFWCGDLLQTFDPITPATVKKDQDELL